MVELIDSAFQNLDREQIRDHHVHVVGLGTGGTGTFVNPRMRQPYAHPYNYFEFLVYKDASGIENEENADREYVERLVELSRAVEGSGRYLLLAFDKHFNADGSVNLEKTQFYVPNDYVLELSERYPDVFLGAMSIHPYRRDAIQALQKWSGRGMRYLKWLPNAMGIDPGDPRIDDFYRAMVKLDVVLLTHAGEEQAVEADEDQALGNPLLLRRPLDLGVKVIVAHCGSLGTNKDLDDREQPEVDNFELFMRLMDEEKYEGQLFGEISAITQINRVPGPLRTLLQRPDIHHRLINGSDYPLPAINIVISTSQLVGQGFITEPQRDALNEIYGFNPLLFDFVLKRTLAHPGTGQKFADSVFERNAGLP